MYTDEHHAKLATETTKVADEEVEHSTKQMIAIAVKQGLLKENGNNYTATIQFDGKQLLVNGNRVWQVQPQTANIPIAPPCGRTLVIKSAIN